MAQIQVNHIKAIGAQATAAFNATEQRNDAQHAGYWAQQNVNAQKSAGFSNYLLDQSVVQNNNVAGHRGRGSRHALEFGCQRPGQGQSRTSGRSSNTPNYWKGIDY